MEGIIGNLRPPITDMPDAITPDGNIVGPVIFLNNVLRLAFVAAGLWVFMNIVIAGFMFINAGGNAETISKAWERIWQSIVGLVIMACSFLVAAVIGILIYRNPMAILDPSLGL